MPFLHGNNPATAAFSIGSGPTECKILKNLGEGKRLAIVNGKEVLLTSVSPGRNNIPPAINPEDADIYSPNPRAFDKDGVEIFYE